MGTSMHVCVGLIRNLLPSAAVHLLHSLKGILLTIRMQRGTL
jgi:hypothetical protein